MCLLVLRMKQKINPLDSAACLGLTRSEFRDLSIRDVLMRRRVAQPLLALSFFDRSFDLQDTGLQIFDLSLEPSRDPLQRLLPRFPLGG